MRKNTFKITKGRMEEQINRKIENNCQAIKLSKEIMKIKNKSGGPRHVESLVSDKLRTSK